MNRHIEKKHRDNDNSAGEVLTRRLTLTDHIENQNKVDRNLDHDSQVVEKVDYNEFPRFLRRKSTKIIKKR